MKTWGQEVCINGVSRRSVESLPHRDDHAPPSSLPRMHSSGCVCSGTHMRHGQNGVLPPPLHHLTLAISQGHQSESLYRVRPLPPTGALEDAVS